MQLTSEGAFQFQKKDFTIAILWYMVMNLYYLLCDLHFFILLSHQPFLPTIMILFMLFALVDIKKDYSFDGRARYHLFF